GRHLAATGPERGAGGREVEGPSLPERRESGGRGDGEVRQPGVFPAVPGDRDGVVLLPRLVLPGADRPGHRVRSGADSGTAQVVGEVVYLAGCEAVGVCCPGRAGGSW